MKKKLLLLVFVELLGIVVTGLAHVICVMIGDPFPLITYAGVAIALLGAVVLVTIVMRVLPWIEKVMGD